MNKVYKVIKQANTGESVAVSEFAKSGKVNKSRSKLLTSGVMTLALSLSTDAMAANNCRPTGIDVCWQAQGDNPAENIGYLTEVYRTSSYVNNGVINNQDKRAIKVSSGTLTNNGVLKSTFKKSGDNNGNEYGTVIDSKNIVNNGLIAADVTGAEGGSADRYSSAIHAQGAFAQPVTVTNQGAILVNFDRTANTNLSSNGIYLEGQWFNLDEYTINNQGLLQAPIAKLS